MKTGRKQFGYYKDELAAILSKKSGQVIQQQQVSRWEKDFEFEVDQEMLGILFDVFYGIKEPADL